METERLKMKKSEIKDTRGDRGFATTVNRGDKGEINGWKRRGQGQRREGTTTA
ncbi:uncharacterized protein G2W53_003300 [Senna tora]|uniref:Uncharacterized protein n=1 Tax=Senna tora TaxID=362788 RepID=A0A834XAL9_9FABA|nr:uncharacterized protein G2W53_003300 [Senna tora]